MPGVMQYHPGFFMPKRKNKNSFKSICKYHKRYIIFGHRNDQTETLKFNSSTIMANISISALEKMVRNFAESTGFEYTIDVFESGKYSNSSPSFIELYIESKKCVCVRILANGYGATNKNYISTDRGWKVAKAELLERMG